MAPREPEEPAAGLWTWTTRHPEWHPGEFGAEVASWAARGEGKVFLLLDPLLPDAGNEPDKRQAVLRLIDAQAKRAASVAIVISVGYHVRSTEELWERLRNERPVAIHGHAAVLRRLPKRAAGSFTEIETGKAIRGGVVPLRIGNPRRQETPLFIPSHSAILFGDAVVGTDGGVRSWADGPVTKKVDRFYRERFNPTVEPLADLGAERLLFTHGPSVMEGGSKALAKGLTAGAWNHRD